MVLLRVLKDTRTINESILLDSSGEILRLFVVVSRVPAIFLYIPKRIKIRGGLKNINLFFMWQGAHKYRF